MRGFVVMAMFAVSFSYAGSHNYSETRNLELDASGLSELFVDAGAGAVVVNGIEDGDEIVVVATIIVGDGDEDEARELIEKRLRLELERDGDRAELKSDFGSGWGQNADALIDLEVSMPAGLMLSIDDGSGSITVQNVAGMVMVDDGSGSIDMANTGDVEIDDGSGSITLENVGAVEIDDGSGSISITGAAGDVYVEDGSGPIDIRGVQGGVTVDDGSGDIEVDDVELDLVIEEAGSGSLRYTNVRGSVEQPD